MKKQNCASRLALFCPEHEAEFDLALQTGMLRGGQYRICWQDVDLKRGVITIPRCKHGESRHIQIKWEGPRSVICPA